MVKTESYAKQFVKQMNRIKTDKKTDIEKMSNFFAKIMKNEGIVQLFGWDSNATLSMELGYRAGGLIQFHQINSRDLVLRGKITQEEFLDPNFGDRVDLVEVFFDIYNIDPRDGFLLTQISQPTKIIDAMAQYLKDHGYQFGLITNSCYPGCKDAKAYQLADYIIDLEVPYPDHSITLENGLRIGPTANLLGNIVAQMITAEIYRSLLEQGEKPELLLSANIAGADDHNRALGEKYDGRYNS